MNRQTAWWGGWRRPALALGAIACAAAGGCVSETTAGVVLLPGERAEARVQGARPWVKIESMTPVEATITSSAGRQTESIQGVLARRLSPPTGDGRMSGGGVRIELRNAGPDTASVFLTARDSSGFSLEKPATPARP